jgi:hypothetical protein
MNDLLSWISVFLFASIHIVSEYLFWKPSILFEYVVSCISSSTLPWLALSNKLCLLEYQMLDRDQNPIDPK